MSTAWYRGKVIPSVIRRWEYDPPSLSSTIDASCKRLLQAVEIWDTPCIVTNFEADVLINPANSRLTGVTKFPYFPKGGPQPKEQPAKDAHHIMGYVTQWGGMEVGQGMMFAANVVDGLVHQLGGANLRKQLAAIGECPEGEAVMTTHDDDDSALPFSKIVHTVPPFYNLSDNNLLQRCYYNSLRLVHQQNFHHQKDSIRVACPLLGAGCRGFPPQEAMQRAANAVVDCIHKETESSALVDPNKRFTLAFGIPSRDLRDTFVQIMEQAMLHCQK
jgi:O-acetyl-ADP-ribose deacetylase (regulator of RNase III)